VLAYGHADTGHDEGRHGGHVDGSALIASRTNDVDGLLGDVRWQRNRRRGVAHRPQEATEFFFRYITLVVGKEKPANVLWRHLPLQYLLHEVARGLMREWMCITLGVCHRTKATSVANYSRRQHLDGPTE